MATGTATVTTATMVMATAIIMVMATAIIIMDTARPAGRGLPSCNDGYHAPVIIVDPSTEFWGRKRGVQSVRTSKTTIAQVNPSPV